MSVALPNPPGVMRYSFLLTRNFLKQTKKRQVVMTRAIITTAGKIELRMMTQIGVCGTGDTKREREREGERSILF